MNNNQITEKTLKGKVISKTVKMHSEKLHKILQRKRINISRYADNRQQNSIRPGMRKTIV